MTYSTQDLVANAARGDALKAAEAFNDLIGDRIASAVQARKLELAQQIFNSSQAEDEDSYEEEEAEEESDVEDKEEENDENS